MIPEHDLAILTVDLPEVGLRRGDVGAVVYVHRDGEAYQVEFVTLDGVTIDVVTLAADQVRAAARGEVMHARLVESLESA